MANGIKLRRGLKTALAGTIAEGEFVFCTDSGELGFKKGTAEKYVDLEKLSTDIDELQDEISVITSNQEVLLPSEFKVRVNKFYDFNVLGTKPKYNGGYRIPIAKVNPLFSKVNPLFSEGEAVALHQVFNFTNTTIQTHNLDSYGEFSLGIFSLENIVFYSQISDDEDRFVLDYSSRGNNIDWDVRLLDDGYGNFALWLEVGINSTQTQKLIIKFTMNCISEVGEDINKQPYNVFLPPLGLEITPYNGAI